MPDVEAIKALFDVGGVVVVTVMLWIVWRRLNDVTDNLIDILSELRLQGLSSTRPSTPKDKQT
jgi:HAMP domain-containing protein